MRKRIYSLLLVFAVLVLCAPACAKEWYEGGTLHNATIAQWKRASRQNKIATCADWLSALYMRGNLNVNISGMNDLKTVATTLVDYIDKASGSTRELDNETANSVALLGMMMAGLIKQNNDTSDSRPVLIEPEPEPVSPLTSAENADQKLKSNGFLLADEIYEIWSDEKTPNVLEQLTDEQKKAIADELSKARKDSEESSQTFGGSIADPLEKTLYQEGVSQNKLLKATRAIAKKYSIQTGDVFTIDNSLATPEIYYEGDNVYEGSNINKLYDYSPAVNRKRSFVIEHIFVDTKWEPDLMVKRFGKYEQYNPSDGNPKVLQMFYFKDIDMSFLVNLLKGEIVTWRDGRADK